MKQLKELGTAYDNSYVKPYYNILERKRIYLFIKRVFDILMSLLLLIIFLPFCIIISILIKIDSRGSIFFIQERVTQYGKIFKIIKFRSMTMNLDKSNLGVTVNEDKRVTRIGKILRKFRLDEIPQLINIFLGDMSFVGIRPEIPKYVNQYSPEMYATLLLKAGVTSDTSIEFRSESELFSKVDDAETFYINDILPKKMKLNLKYIKEASMRNDILIILKTVVTMFKRGE